MRAVAVVFGHPGIHCGLGRQQVVEGFGIVEELTAQGFMEPLDFSGGGRTGGFGESVGDAVVAANPVEQHFGAFAEAIGELFAIVREHFLGHPVTAQGLGKRQAHRSPGRPAHDRGHHTESGVVIDPGDHLAFGAIGEKQPADDVDLP